MADGSEKMIRDVKIGDSVITFHPETFECSETKITMTQTRLSDKNMYELTTISGQSIKATYDHKFMTDQGWKTVEEMDSTTKIMIHSHQESISHTVERYLIIDEEMFKQNLTEKIGNHLISLHIKN
jgi:Protein of unknown function (DUF1557).